MTGEQERGQHLEIAVLFQEDQVLVQIGDVGISREQFERFAGRVAKVLNFLHASGQGSGAGPETGPPGPPHPPASPQLRIATTEELARLLSVPKSKIYHLVAQQKIPVLRLGRSLRFRVDDVLQSVGENRPTAEETGAQPYLRR